MVSTKAPEVAIAYVFDSSVDLANEWGRVQPTLSGQYMQHFIARLREGHPDLQTHHIALVCYASSSTRPSPLLAKTYFTSLQNLFKAKDPSTCGAGQTSRGGGRGMAVLEGLVAAIELFDVLTDYPKSAASKNPALQNLIKHIVHVTACNPDSAERPTWNVNPALDQLTWEALPSELKKREINYNLINLRPCQKLEDFHTAVAGPLAQTPWFTLRPQHTARLMGFPAPSPKTPQGVKRAIESGPSPEVKRVRTSNQASPSTTNSPTPGAAIARPGITTTQPSVSPQLNVAAQPSSGPQKAASTPQSDVTAVLQNVDMEKMQKLVLRVQALEADLKPKEEIARNLEAAGKVEEARLYRQEHILPIRTNTEKLKGIVRTVMAVKANEKAGKPQTTSAGGADDSSASQPPPPPPSGAGGLVSNTASSAAQVNTPMDTPSLSNARPISQPQLSTQTSPVPLPGPPLPSGTSPQVAAQMRKLIEQQNRTPRIPSAASGLSTNANMQPTLLGMGAIRPNIWRGTLTWKGFDATSHVRRELQATVHIQFKTAPEGLAAWPHALGLTPAPPAVPPLMLQEWAKAHQNQPFAGIITVNESADAQVNTENFRSLVRLLQDRNIYAMAAWQGLDGTVKNRLLLFVNQGKLLAFYFAAGVPELPKTNPPQQQQQQQPQPQPQPAANNLNQAMLKLYHDLPNEQRALLNQLPPDKLKTALQQLFMTRMVTLRQQQQQQQQQNQQLQQAQQQAYMGTMAGVPGGQASQQMSAPMSMPNAFAGRPSAGFQAGQQMAGASTMMNFGQPQMPTNGVNAPNSLGGLSFGGMRQRMSGSGGAAGAAMPNLSAGVLQSFMQRNQDGANAGM